FYNDHALFDDYTGLVYESDEGKRIAETLGNKKAIILQNHGLLTVGQSVDSAAWWFITMEKVCKVQLTVEAVQKPICINEKSAQIALEQTGIEYEGWFNFQPLWNRIIKEQPDLLL
ncbi:class II aldolase/adducin family protein, partial [Alkalihalophilus pseudofirmus]